LYIVDSQGGIMRVTTRRWSMMDVYVPLKVLLPGARVVHETYLFGTLHDTASAKGQLQYLFPSSGKYTVFARYVCADPILEIESNRITANVGSPVARWNDLEKAGIVYYIEGCSRSNEENEMRRAELVALLAQVSANPYNPWFMTPAAAAESKVSEVSAETRIGIESALQRFINAWSKNNLEECGQYLAEDFLYNGIIGREKFIEELQESVEKLSGADSVFSITVDSVKMIRVEDNIEVTCHLKIISSNANIHSEDRASIIFAERNNAWLIYRWNRLEP
ncbi:MAG: nuclear transport factor 2 family protein, partial [candidate division Zixibacteria bacterium]|nr:nuclear transport factor 2 family protein [candidate division Zixibacteria bacterium]